MSPLHASSAMSVVDRYNHVKRSSRRSWRVWHNVWWCSRCGATANRAANPNSGYVFFCDGDAVVRRKRLGTDDQTPAEAAPAAEPLNLNQEGGKR